MTRSSGTLSGATTSTSMPRARSDAATSSPMKLAPTTTTRFAEAERATIALLSAKVRRYSTCLEVAPGMTSCTGSAPVAISSEPYPRLPPSASVTRFVPQVERGDARVEEQVDAGARRTDSGPERNPFFLRRAGEVVLGEVGPVARRGIVGTDHGEWAIVALTPQHVGRRESRRTAAHDHDRFGCPPHGRPCRAPRELLPHEEPIALHAPHSSR